ncbi:hypothetical protein GGR54DRAFT_646476 [Hypoxylon sp. NC1633]|nr:hypothetical protein GGR54DRAFT_646476 [Hypoxylon sp. NC1633]
MADPVEERDPVSLMTTNSASDPSLGSERPEKHSSDSGEDEMICPICRENISTTLATTLPCSHAFHADCIREWTQVHDKAEYQEGRLRCPYCRRDLKYKCGDVITKHHLRPGVKILPKELTVMCPSWHWDSPNWDKHSVSEEQRPIHPDYLGLGDLRQALIEAWQHGETPLQFLAGIGLQLEDQNPDQNPDQEQDSDEDDHSSVNDEEQEQGEDGLAPPPGSPQIFGELGPPSVESGNEPLTDLATLYSPSSSGDEIDNSSDDEVAEDKKATTAGVLDIGFGVKIENEIEWILYTKLKELKFKYPHVKLFVRRSAIDALYDRLQDLLLRRKVFGREHEGWIELNDEARRYRDAKEEEMRLLFDEFFPLLEKVRRQVEASWAGVASIFALVD